MNKTNYKVLSSYRMLLRHYYELGVGYYCKFSGVKITDQLIDVLQNRYLELGGKMEDISKVDPDFSEA
tara:strand:- start:800 stop:1003 length:204 start_codon:yes stop_codon:yes gene_type:complete